jgi:drug/metabolite transporter (DMT)-like permease
VRAGKPKILELAAVVSFAGVCAVVFAIDPGSADTLHRYARGIAAGLLAAIAFGSLLFTPLTEQYARDAVPQRVWDPPQFKAVKRTSAVRVVPAVTHA